VSLAPGPIGALCGGVLMVLPKRKLATPNLSKRQLAAKHGRRSTLARGGLA